MDEQNLNNDKELKKQRNIANNANNVRVAADIASKTNNPYAKAAGLAVKAADKISGGKASESLGKAINLANKITPGGRIAQAAMNKMSESGPSDRIGKALNKGKGSTPSKLQSNAAAEDKKNNGLDKKEVVDVTSDGGEVNTKISAKFLKGAIAVMPLFLIVLVFLNLMTAASQTYLSVIGLDHADSVSDTDADKKIRENGSEGLDKEITDNTAYNFTDIFIDDNVYSKKLNKLNFISKTKVREYSEADLTELEDFYSDINSYEGHDMDTVYKFFFKLLYIQRRYKKSYNVDLDMALIMSIVSVQSEDKSEVFIKNIKDYKVTPKENNEYFNYYYDWSTYKSTREDSSHDIELLARNMVTKTSDSGCPNTVDGACYKIVEDSVYREFLKEFIERKYYIDGGYVQNTIGTSSKDGNYVANITFTDSSFGNIYYYNQQDYPNYYYSKDPSKPEYKDGSGWATIKSHGCGPTSLAMVVSSILNRTVDPIETTTKVCVADGWTADGSYAYVLVKVAKEYGIKTSETANAQDVINALATNLCTLCDLFLPFAIVIPQYS